MTEPVVVHVLHHGLPLCRFTTEMPGSWPPGNKWVGLLDSVHDITCPVCKERAPALRKSEGLPENSQ